MYTSTPRLENVTAFHFRKYSRSFFIPFFLVACVCRRSVAGGVYKKFSCTRLSFTQRGICTPSKEVNRRLIQNGTLMARQIEWDSWIDRAEMNTVIPIMWRSDTAEDGIDEV